VTEPQNPNPWAKPEGTYEVTAVSNMGLPMPPPPEPAPPLDHAQWQNPYSTPAHGTYQVQAMNQGFPMQPLPSVLPQELAPARPETITAAMWIWIAGAVLSVAVIPLLLLMNIDFLLDQDSSIRTREDRQAAEFGVRAVALVSGVAMLVAAAPYIAFAIVLRNGHNWARILLTILGVLGIISMTVTLIIGLGAQSWQAGVTVCIVVIGLTVAAVVLQFLPPSNRFVR
jgi:hypothetical protein